jgi:succinyl-diaminopimelate desuccinylase
VQTLRELVSFKSVKDEAAFAAALAGGGAGEGPFGAEVAKAYHYMLDRARADGFDVCDVDGWGGHIEWPGAETDERGEIVAAADRTLGIPVHLDVVPAGDGWTGDAWTLREEGGRLYGRGTSDDKGAAVSVYYAMKALRESGFVPAKNIRLMLGLDEETGWAGMRRYLEQVPPPDFGFSPDGDFPVIRGEKGMLVFELAKKLEPSREQGLQVRSITGGNAPNMVPDACRAILVYEEGVAAGGGKASRKKGKASAVAAKSRAQEAKAFELVKKAASAFRERTGHVVNYKGRGRSVEITAEGVSAHGAHPEGGVNAISVLMQLLSELPIAGEGVRDFVDFYRNHIDFETDGKGLGIAASDVASGRLIVNVGQIELGREAAILTVNVRNPVTRQEDDVYADLRPLIDRYSIGVVKVSGNEPLYFEDGDPLVQTLLDVYRECTGDMVSSPLVIGGGTYARAIPHAVAYGPAFPGRPEVMHQKDEYVEGEDLMRSCHIYAEAILRLSGRDFTI